MCLPGFSFLLCMCTYDENDRPHLFNQENLHNQRLTKYFLAPLYLLQQQMCLYSFRNIFVLL